IESKEMILDIANELFHKHWNLKPIRLLGITVQDMEDKQHIVRQLDLFTYEQEAKKEPLYQAIDTLKVKYGEDLFKQLDGQVENNDEELRTSFQKDFLDDYKRL